MKVRFLGATAAHAGTESSVQETWMTRRHRPGHGRTWREAAYVAGGVHSPVVSGVSGDICRLRRRKCTWYLHTIGFPPQCPLRLFPLRQCCAVSGE